MGNICIIGPRGSGKTTYLAGLAYWTELHINSKKGKIFTVEPLNEDTLSLKEKAENIICQGASFRPTGQEFGQVMSVYDAPLYQFKIKVNNLWHRNDEINLVVRDYPGEVFEELENREKIDSIYEDFIQESLAGGVVGCLILLTGWGSKTDKAYCRSLRSFIGYMGRNNRMQDFRLAIGMSMSERGELWSGRIEPEVDIFEVHLPETRKLLRDRIPKSNLKFYSLSTFGVLDKNDPRPNRVNIRGRDGQAAILKDVPQWKPYNAIAPLYWLSKGRNLLV
jgi:hypothetical protein